MLLNISYFNHFFFNVGKLEICSSAICSPIREPTHLSTRHINRVLSRDLSKEEESKESGDSDYQN